MAGILGRLFREFAVTITTAVVISGIVSVTLTPMLCSRFLQIKHTKKGLAGLFDRGFDAMHRGYARSLRLALNHRAVMIVVFGLVVWATVHMFGIVPKGFIPDSDNDALFVNMRAAQGTSYYEMVGMTEKVADLLNRNPYVDAMMVNTGGGAANGMNQSRVNIQLTPRATRPVSASQIAQQLRQIVNRFPQFRGSVNVPQSLQIGGFRGDSGYNLMVESLNSEELYTWTPRLMDAISQLPEVTDVSTNLESRSPRVDLQIDRDKAASVGLNASTIANALGTGLGPRWATTIYGQRSQYRVLLELDPQYQQQADTLQKISFKTPAGGMVPLESVVRFKETVGPQSVNHIGQLPAVSISFNVRNGVSLGDAVSHVTEVAKGMLPPTVTTTFQGSAKVFQQSMSNLTLLLVIAIGVVYIVLGMMTTMAAMLGAVPIAIGYGAGGEARQPLGLAVVGGLLFSQLVTLYLTPVVFTYMAQLQRWMQSHRAPRHEELAATTN